MQETGYGDILSEEFLDWRDSSSHDGATISDKVDGMPGPNTVTGS